MQQIICCYLTYMQLQISGGSSAFNFVILYLSIGSTIATQGNSNYESNLILCLATYEVYTMHYHQPNVDLELLFKGLESYEDIELVTNGQFFLSPGFTTPFQANGSAAVLTGNEELKELKVVLSDARDNWQWLLDDSGCFSVQSTKLWLFKTDQQVRTFVLDWSKWVPLKVNTFVWRAEMERIATKTALARWNIQVGRGNTNEKMAFDHA
ncbi:hypothetical protein M8C21_017077, partial [Ambrosia artemisiifolia]